MATHSSTLAWKIPWMEEPGRLQSMGSLRVGILETVLVAQLCLTLSDPHEPHVAHPHGTHVACQAPPWNFLSRNTGVDCHCLLQGIFDPRIEPRSPVSQAASLPSEPPGKLGVV